MLTDANFICMLVTSIWMYALAKNKISYLALIDNVTVLTDTTFLVFRLENVTILK